jgi:hypothetical protein
MNFTDLRLSVFHSAKVHIHAQQSPVYTEDIRGKLTNINRLNS